MHSADIRQNLNDAVCNLLRNDYFLLEHDVHEQSITHRIAVYLEPLFSTHNVDCEYNNDLDSESGRKAIDESLARPDIIVHHRGLNGSEHNLLVVELKKETNIPTDLEADRRKLRGFTGPSHFGYRCGALVILGVRDRAGHVYIEWFEGGELALGHEQQA